MVYMNVGNINSYWKCQEIATDHMKNVKSQKKSQNLLFYDKNFYSNFFI